MIDTVTERALKLRGLVVLAVLGIVGYGVYAYHDMPVDAFPDISPIMVPVFAEGHGMAPEEIERLVTYPIETAMNGLPGVKQIKSTSASGLAVVYVYFEDDVDIYFARQLVAERLAGASSELPDLEEQPALGPISTGLGQVFLYYLTLEPDVDTQGKAPLTYLRELNDWVVKYQLQTVPGVTDILSIGGHVLQYQIRVNPKALQEFDVSLEELVEAVQGNNRNVGGQFLVLGAEESLVRGLGLVEDLEDIRAIPVKVRSGVPIAVADVAEVSYGSEIRRGVVTQNGEREVVSGIVLKLFGENTSEVIGRLHKKIESIQASLPEGVRVVPYYEQAELVQHATWTVKKALLQGGLLVLLVLFVFLANVRGAIIVSLSLPISALAALICMRHFDVSANLMSLGGIAVAIGMLGDGAIVMIENISRHLGEATGGKSAREILLGAAREVGRPIAFSGGIIIAVFLPIFTLQGVEGKMFAPMAFTISFALFGSILVAIVVAPVLASFLLRKKGNRRSSLLKALKAAYRPTLLVALRLRTLVVALAGLGFLASLALLPGLGTEFIPTLEEGSLVVGVTMAPSISLEKAVDTVMALERRIRQHPGVRETVSRIGRPEAGSHPHPVNYAEIQIALDGRGDAPLRRTKAELVEALSHELGSHPGAHVNFTQPIQNAFDELLAGIRAELAIKLYGEDLKVLEGKAEEIEKAIEDVPGLVDLAAEQSFGQPQIQVIPDRAACARYGVSVNEILELVELAIGGEVIDTLYQNTRRFGIHLRLQEPYRRDVEAMRRLLVHTADKSLIPLSQVAEVREVVGPIQINREKNQRRWTVQGNVRGRDLGSVVADIRNRIDERVDLPSGYFVEYGGQFENQQRAMKRLAIVVPVVIAVVCILLWLSFSSMRDAFIVMANVPLALIGGILGLYWTGEYLSVPASVGFIALFGIAVQNGVVLVSYFRQLRAEGKPLETAIVEGSLLRLRPVLMTALTTVLGLLPLLLSQGIGSEVQRPLAVVVVFGLTTSTLLTLYVLPAVYSWTGDREAEVRKESA